MRKRNMKGQSGEWQGKKRPPHRKEMKNPPEECGGCDSTSFHHTTVERPRAAPLPALPSKGFQQPEELRGCHHRSKGCQPVACALLSVSCFLWCSPPAASFNPVFKCSFEWGSSFLCSPRGSSPGHLSLPSLGKIPRICLVTTLTN